MMMNGQRRCAERRRQGADDAPGQRSIALLRLGLVRGLEQRDRLALRGEPRLSKHSRRWMLSAQKKGVVVLVNAGSGIGFGETTQLRNGITAEALGIDYDGEGSRLSQKALFIGLVLLPIRLPAQHDLGVASPRRRYAPSRASSACSACGSRCSPRLPQHGSSLAWCRRLFGTPLGQHQTCSSPTSLSVLIATAVTGVLWAVFRLGVAYTGTTGSAYPASPTGGDARS